MLGLGIFSFHFLFSLEHTREGTVTRPLRASCSRALCRGETEAQGLREGRKGGSQAVPFLGSLGASPVPVEATEAQGQQQGQGDQDQDEGQHPGGQRWGEQEESS